MSDRITLITRDARHRVVPPAAGTTLATVAGAACPHCGAEPWHLLRRSEPRPSADDRHWEGEAACADCGEPVGTVREAAHTLFGLSEDLAVLKGRCRVY